MDISSVLKNFQEQLVKINKKVLGYFYYDEMNNKFSYDYAILNPIDKPSIESIPFCFDPDKSMGPSVLKIGSAGYTTEKGQEINNIDELIYHLRVNWFKYVQEIEKKNPREFKDDYQDLLNVCEEFSELSYPLFTEKTQFTFPKNLLNSFRALTYGEYENCGIIRVSKIVDKASHHFGKYDYEVIFHSEDENHCVSGTAIEGTGEIHFHTHPVQYEPKSSNLDYDYIFIYSCFNTPSFEDLILDRKQILQGLYHITLVFTYGGIWLTRREKLSKDIDINLKIPDLSEEDKERYEKQYNRLFKVVLRPYGKFINEINKFDEETNQEISNYNRLFLDNILITDYDINEMKKRFNKGDKSDEELLTILTEKKGPNIDDLRRLFDLAPDWQKNMKWFAKNVVEPLLNKGIKDKLVCEYYPVEKKEGRWQYPDLSVQVYPHLRKVKGAYSTRRLTFQKP